MGDVIATLTAVVGSDITGFMNGMNTVKATLGGVGKSIGSLGDTLSGLGRNLTVLTAPIAAGLGIATKNAMDFDSVMHNVAAVTGTTGKQLDTLGSLIRAIGADSRYGPVQAAQAFYDIAGGVVDASVRMAVLKAAIDTAQAGQADLGTTTRALIAIMNGYGFTAKQAAFASDVLTRTVGMGVGTMDQFASALPKVTGMSKMLGVSFDDLGAMMAYITTKGTSASEAATELSGMMTALVKPNKEMEAALKAIGFQTGQAAIKALGLAGVYKALKNAGFGDQMAKLTGRVEAFRGAVALTEVGTDKFFKTFKGGIKGATKDAEALQMQSFAAQADLLKANLEDLGITVGNVLLPVLNDLLKGIKPIVAIIAEWFKANPELASTIVKVAAGVALLGPVLMVAGTALSAIGGLIGGLGAIVGAVLSPVGLLVAGIAALGGALYLAATGQLPEFINRIGEFVAQAVPALLGAFGDLLGRVGDWLKGDGPGKLITGFVSIIQDVVTWLTTDGWNTFRGGVEGLINAAGAWLKTDGPQRFSDGIQDIFEKVSLWIEWNAWPAIKDAFSSLFNSIGTWITGGGALQFVGDVGSMFIQAADWIVKNGPTEIQRGLTAVFNWLTDLFSKTDALGLVAGIGQAVIDAANWIINSGVPIVADAFGDIITAVLNLLGQITQGIIDSVVNGIRNAIAQATGIQTGEIGYLDSSMKASEHDSSGGGFLDAAFGSMSRDSGGPGRAGQSYMIGTGAQPEMFTPSTSGMFTPNAGGYSGPHTLEVVLRADDFEQRIYLNVAEAIGAA